MAHGRKGFPEPAGRPRTIVDCDMGVDDGAALLLALACTDLLGVTTCFGLTSAASAAARAARLLSLAAASRPGAAHIPVVPGSTQPLAWRLHEAAPHPGHSGAAGSAAGFIIETVLAAEGPVYIIAMGPMTNLALALRQAPDLRDRIAGISFMGGSTSFGNVTPVAEFNIWADPEAAHVVLGSGIPLRMCGLNITHRIRLPEAAFARLVGAPSPAVRFWADLCREQGHLPLHDPCAVLALTHPSLFTFQPMAVAVELQGSLTRGMTVCDQRPGRAGSPPPPGAASAEVATDVDVEGATAVLVDQLVGL